MTLPHTSMSSPCVLPSDPSPTSEPLTMSPDSKSPLFQELPDESVIEIARWLPAAKDIVSLQLTCRRMRSVLNQPSVVTVLSRDREIPSQIGEKINSLEALGIWEAMDEAGLLSENRIGFAKASAGNNEDDGNVQGSTTRVETAKRLLEKFPSCRVVVDSHCGTFAPRGIALQFSQVRAMVVADMLRPTSSCGKNQDKRLVLRRWGNQVAELASQSSHRYGELARKGFGWVELYIELDGLELPSRPCFYPGLRVM